jgi:hypothetical protein
LWEFILNDGYKEWIIRKGVGGVFRGGKRVGGVFFLAFKRGFFLVAWVSERLGYF